MYKIKKSAMKAMYKVLLDTREVANISCTFRTIKQEGMFSLIVQNEEHGTSMSIGVSWIGQNITLSFQCVLDLPPLVIRRLYIQRNIC